MNRDAQHNKSDKIGPQNQKVIHKDKRIIS